MKRDDIIKQKLFESYKLTEFYLNLIVDDRYNYNNYTRGVYEETPFQLAKAYSNKLLNIITRYDNLLNKTDSKQNQQHKCVNETFAYKFKDICNNSEEDDYDELDEYQFNYIQYNTIRSRELKKNKKQKIELQTINHHHYHQQQQHNATTSHIKKSLSNLSKDSGLYFDMSHHSDASSCISNVNSNDALTELSNITNSFISEQYSENDYEDDYDCYNERNSNYDNMISPKIKQNTYSMDFAQEKIMTRERLNSTNVEEIMSPSSYESTAANLDQTLISENEPGDTNQTYYNNEWCTRGISPASSHQNILCDDNDSLMNVSMIDNIEAVYKNPNDSMTSSILTFI